MLDSQIDQLIFTVLTVIVLRFRYLISAKLNDFLNIFRKIYKTLLQGIVSGCVTEEKRLLSFFFTLCELKLNNMYLLCMKCKPLPSALKVTGFLDGTYNSDLNFYFFTCKRLSLPWLLSVP